MSLYVPERHNVLDIGPDGKPTGRMSRPWLTLFNDITSILGIIIGPGGVAPSNAQYIVAAANGVLTAERVATDTATVAWDFSVAGQAKANALVSGFSLRGLRSAQPLPAATPVGAQYYVTDEKVTEYNTGAAWVVYSTAQATAGIAQIDLNGDIRATGLAASGISFIGTLVSNGFSSNIVMRRARDAGAGVPGAMQANDTIGAYVIQGHDGTAYGPTNIGAMLFNATENFTTIAKGCELVFAVTPNGSTTRQDRWRVGQAGNFESVNGTETIRWGTTASFPMLKRSTVFIQSRLADDSGYAGIDAGNYSVGGVAGASGTGGTVTAVNGIVTAVSGASGGGGYASALMLMGG